MAKTKTKTKAKTKSTKSGVSGLMSMASKKTSTSTKSTVPKEQIPSDLTQPAKDFIQAYEDQKSAESRKEIAEEALVDRFQERRIQRCHQDGKLYATLGWIVNSHTIKMTQTSGHRNIDAELSENWLRSLFGSDFEKYFYIKPSVKIKIDKMTDDEIVLLEEALKNILGEKSQEVLVSEMLIKPTEAFVHDRIFNKDVARKSEMAKEEGHCVPNKPSFKI